MPGSPVSGTYTSGITLSVNPTTIASTAIVDNTAASGAAVTGSAGTTWTLTNLGTVSETATGGTGVVLASGGSVTNSASITGDKAGVHISGGAGFVSNAGSIVGVSNYGIELSSASGGTVTNQSGGVIAAGVDAIYVVTGSGAGIVSNSGTIAGGTTGFAGINLSGGGSVTNASGGTITGSQAGVFIANGTGGTVSNAGSIGATKFDGIWLETGGTVTNASGGTIKGSYSTYGAGVYLSGGGSVTNQSGGLIGGLRGVYALNVAATVVNAGHIVGSGTTIGAATAVSYGGVYLGAGGSVTNQSGGIITGYQGVYGKAGTATVVNAGSIGGNSTSGKGILLKAAGTVTNQSGGTISGGADAVKFASGFTNRLVIDPHATFTGTVDGGNTIGAGSISTLELASGASAGTLTGLGTQFIDFAQTTIDASSNWTFSGTNALVSGATLTNSGTLTDTGTLLNSGTLTGNRLNLNGGALTNQTGGLLTATYVYGVSTGGVDTVVNQGTITNSTNLAVYLKAAGNVSNAGGGVISGYGSAVKLKGTDATLSSLGQITSTSTGPGGYGVYLRNGGLITNGQGGSGTSTASIRGYYGVAFKTVDVVNAYGTLVNFGTVLGTGSVSSAVLLSNAGTVFNGQSGATAALIEGGRYGVSDGRGPVVNFGTVIATGTASGYYGVAIQGSGSVGNLGTAALIEGYVGVLIGTDGTVTNAGTIESNQGASGGAIHFTGGNARLIDDPGAVFIGAIYGGSGGTAVMELASGSSAGTISGFGTIVTNFTALVFDSGAQWTVVGNDSANGLGTLGISGFTFGDTIDLTNFAAANRAFASNVLTLGDGIGDYQALHIQGGFTTGDFQISSDTHGGTDITVLCFCAGTRIATPTGEVAVERLAVGDRVQMLLRGKAEPVVWIGHRHVDCTRHPQPHKVWPVRISAGAFGLGRPHTDLFLSPDHAVYVNEVLIPVKHLINGATIVQVPVDTVTYYHVELPGHDVLLAEGLPAESYLDTGDRANFVNGGGPIALYPDFASRVWEAEGCARLVVTGPELAAARHWVNALAAQAASPANSAGDPSARPARKPRKSKPAGAARAIG